MLFNTEATFRSIYTNFVKQRKESQMNDNLKVFGFVCGLFFVYECKFGFSSKKKVGVV
jgi:hypothetical protein